MDQSARIQAARQWNRTPCGEVDGAKDVVDYFDSVEKERYSQQPWQHSYFGFERFADKTVLEIGTGQGSDLMQFAKAGAICNGVDITDQHLALTQRNFDLRKKKVELFKADATKLPFQDGTIDCVYSFGVIHHIPEADAVIAEVYRVLRPGGVVMIAVYHKWSAVFLFKWLLIKGLFKGELFRLGYAGLLATIEQGADGKQIKPFVRLYSKRSTRMLLRNFQIDDVSVQQFALNHLLPTRFCGDLSNRQLPFSRQLGWYVACKARKPLVGSRTES